MVNGTMTFLPERQCRCNNREVSARLQGEFAARIAEMQGKTLIYGSERECSYDPANVKDLVQASNSKWKARGQWCREDASKPKKYNGYTGGRGRVPVCDWRDDERQQPVGGFARASVGSSVERDWDGDSSGKQYADMRTHDCLVACRHPRGPSDRPCGGGERGTLPKGASHLKLGESER